jgi:hypothetical protein
MSPTAFWRRYQCSSANLSESETDDLITPASTWIQLKSNVTGDWNFAAFLSALLAAFLFTFPRCSHLPLVKVVRSSGEVIRSLGELAMYEIGASFENVERAREKR